jgi:hypothetical protein
MADTRKVVAAFIAPDTSTWQSAQVIVTDDGAWHVFDLIERQWRQEMPPLNAPPQAPVTEEEQAVARADRAVCKPLKTKAEMADDKRLLIERRRGEVAALARAKKGHRSIDSLLAEAKRRLKAAHDRIILAD